MIVDTTDGVDLMGQIILFALTKPVKNQCQVYQIASSHRVGLIADKVFSELIISTIGKIPGDSLAFVVEIFNNDFRTGSTPSYKGSYELMKKVVIKFGQRI